jgi:hypothetical protein
MESKSSSNHCCGADYRHITAEIEATNSVGWKLSTDVFHKTDFTTGE